jgi:nicotinamidase-related amidase
VNGEVADLTRPPVAPRPITLPTDTKQVSLDLNKTACLVVDMQNDFCHPDGWLASIGVDVTPARTPIGPLVQLLPVLRDVQIPIIWVNWSNRPDLLNISPALRHRLQSQRYGGGLRRSPAQQWCARVDQG